MCCSRKYPYPPPPPPGKKGFFQLLPIPRKFQLSFIHFIKRFGLIEPPTLQEFQSLLWGEEWIFSGTAQYARQPKLTALCSR